jgi:hypothetical protein
MVEGDSLVNGLKRDLGVAFHEVRVDGCEGLAAAIPEPYAAIDRVKPLAVEVERSGRVLFVGLHGDDRAYRLFLLPVGSLDVVRLFRVGVHNAPKDAWMKVDETLRRIHAVAPFSVYFADEAGYKAAFATPVDKKRAQQCERMILRIDPAAMDLDDLPVWERIHRRGVLELWWD